MVQATTIVYQKKQGYKMIRQYMMGELLGEGQQGKVCSVLVVSLSSGHSFPKHALVQVKEAIDSNTLRRVAIKIVNLRQLRKVRNGESNSEENVRRELGIHRKLKHPNIVELIEQVTSPCASSHAALSTCECAYSAGTKPTACARCRAQFILAEKQKLYAVLEHVPGGNLQVSAAPFRLSRPHPRARTPGPAPIEPDD